MKEFLYKMLITRGNNECILAILLQVINNISVHLTWILHYLFILTGLQELEAARSSDCSQSSSSSSANTAGVGGGVVGGFVAGVLITIVLAIIILLLIGWKWYI